MTRSPFSAIAAAVLVLSGSGAALAQGDDLAHLSLVAGYKAAFTCSATFNAGRTQAQIVGDELNRIYPDYRDAMAALPPAVIDAEAKTVTVSYHKNYPPRVSAWRPHLGCAQLPPFAPVSAATSLPTVSPSASEQIAPALKESTGRPSTKLNRTVTGAFDRATYGEGTETTAVLVVRDGQIIAERYRDGFDAQTPQRTWSVAKSIAATIIGAAVKDGLIDVNAPTGINQWSSAHDPRSAITLKNLMQMGSGLTSPTAGNRTDDIYFGGGRVVDHAITNRMVAAPGSRWRYANNDTMSMMRALHERMGDDAAFLAYPFEKILQPLGMTHTFLETDWNGDFIMSSQVWTTARDLAQLGELYLHDGVVGGQRLLPEGWANYVATPAPAQPPLSRPDGSARPGYGAQFWLFDKRLSLPDGTYAAMGNRGQYVMIIPARNVIIIRRGFDDNGGLQFDIAKFSADILASLPAR